MIQKGRTYFRIEVKSCETKQARDEENCVAGCVRKGRMRTAPLKARIRRGTEEESCPLCLQKDAKHIPLIFFNSMHYYCWQLSAPHPGRFTSEEGVRAPIG
jgi:hypothetical protein